MKTFKFKLYSSKKNKRLSQIISLSGRASNHFVAMQKRHYKLFGKKISLFDLQAHVAKKNKYFKKLINEMNSMIDSGAMEFPEFDEKYQRLYWKFGYMTDIPSQALQQVVERIENGYRAFFESRKSKSKRKVGLPGFQSSRRYKSFTLKQAGWKYEESGFLEQNSLILIGEKYKFFKSRAVEGKVQTVSVKRNSIGELYICFACLEKHETDSDGNKIKVDKIKNKTKKEKELEAREKLVNQYLKILMMSGKTALGIDFGLKDFLVLSNGVKLQSPEFLKRSIKKLKTASRKHSKKTKGSNNRERARLELARLHEKISNQRLEWARKTAHEICKTLDGKPGFIFVEDLNLQAMKKLWGRKVSDVAYGLFVKELEMISTKYNTKVVKTNRFEKTTGVCVHSGLVKPLSLNDRSWFCEGCNETHDRDMMAAQVIYESGLKLVNSLIEDTVVSPSKSDGEQRVV